MCRPVAKRGLRVRISGAPPRPDPSQRSPMPREIPPTPSLRAFSRAARTLSFKRAAEELHVSPSALSRQIQALEEHLGVALFQRLNPGLALTEAGRRYLAAVDAALAQLESAQDRFGAPRR